jgi:hypothetical protein
MKPQVKYGLLTGAATFIILVVMKFAATERLGIMLYMYIFLISAGIFYAIRTTRGKTGFISYGRALGIGTLTALVSGSVAGVLLYFYSKFINHAVIVRNRSEQVDLWESGKVFHVNSEQMAMLKANLNLMVSPGTLGIGEILNEVFFGFILALLIAAILKKENPSTNMPDF